MFEVQDDCCHGCYLTGWSERHDPLNLHPSLPVPVHLEQALEINHHFKHNH